MSQQLTEAKVNRNCRQNTQSAQLALLSAAPLSAAPPSCTGCQIITVVNNRPDTVKLYLGINNASWGNYTPADFPGFQTDIPCNLAGFVLSTTLQPNTPLPICFCTATKGRISIALSPDMCPWGDCPQTLGEFTFIGADNKDTLDISLVNGFMYPMSISSLATTPASTVAEVTQATDNQNQLNVYPLSCDVCTVAVGPPTWPQCQQKPFDQRQCKKWNGDPNNLHAGDPPCHTDYPMGANYTVTIN